MRVWMKIGSDLMTRTKMKLKHKNDELLALCQKSVKVLAEATMIANFSSSMGDHSIFQR